MSALAGCSVPLAGLMTLRIEDDHIVADILMCDDYTASEIHLLPRDGGSILRLFPHPAWKFDPAQSASIDLGSVGEFTDVVGESGGRFEVSASGGVVLTPRFDDAAITSLGSGEYLARPSRVDVVVSAEELKQAMTEICSY